MNSLGERLRIRLTRSPIMKHPGIVMSGAALLLLAYVPLLLSSPGDVPGDTKLYLYLDPWRLISDSLWTWDNRQLGGWVPHQNVGYLWPTGPWFAIWEALGVPDWIAHRVWLGTMLLTAGLGTLWLARRLGLGVGAAFVAALAYQLSPYVLPYISRTSALLLPWALLPWMCGVVIAIAIHRRWWHVVVFAALVVSSGGLNATALLMIAPGPLIWLIHLRRTDVLSTRRFLSVTTGLAAVSVAVSAWWLVGLWVQGRYGAAVLSYSEALVSTAATSSAPEVLRGLGYWLFYDRNEVVALTSASTPYQGHLLVMAAGALLALTGLWGIISHRQWRWPLMTSVLVGTILAVGAHPFDDPSPLWSFAAEHPRHALSLALRSSSRAVPIVVLALALGLGLALNRIGPDHFSLKGRVIPRRTVALGAAVVVIGVNMPALFGGRLIDPVMTRPNDVPTAWSQAAQFLDERYDQGFTGSVLLVPGIESAAYRWGYPVDPILPGLSKKPLISRDWLPLGSAPLMDLVYALDDSFQSGTARADTVAPIARLLGADTVMVVNSHQYERFGTIRPERAQSIFADDPPGLRPLARFGAEVINQALPLDPEHPTWSEELIAFPHRPLAEIQLYEVTDPAPLARTATTPGIVAADGTGLVDLATAGLIDGQHLLIAEAALDDPTLSALVGATNDVLITDSNRRRAHHWRSSQEVWGATEPESGILLDEDLFDSRLPVFAHNSLSSQTIVVPSSLKARASSYGPALTFHPEHRPTMAIDGNIATAWRTGTHGDPRGQILEITSDAEPIRRLRLVQPLDANPLRWITAIHVKTDADEWSLVELTDASRSPSGQIIEIPNPARVVSLRIESIEWTAPATANRGPGVGFAELIEVTETSPERLVVPHRVQEFTNPKTTTSFLFNRWRGDSFARWRDDPEATIERDFTTSRQSSYVPAVTARLHAAARDSLIVQALSWTDGLPAASMGANGRLRGSLQWWGMSALDANPSTVWWTASPLDITADPIPEISIPLTNAVTTLTLTQVRGPKASRVTGIEIEVRSRGELLESFDLTVPPPDSAGQSQISVPAVDGDQMVIRLRDIEAAIVRDEHSGLLTPAPVGVIDITSDGWSALSIPERFDTGCRSDLVTIDGKELAIRLQGLVSSVLAGDPVDAEICDASTLQLPAGEHRLSTTRGDLSGWEIDTVLLRDSRRHSTTDTRAADISQERGQRRISGLGCGQSCWLEVSDGWNTGWSASISGQTLSDPVASAGGRNLWFVDSPTVANDVAITLTWTPQRAMWWALAVTVMALVALGLFAGRERVRSRVASASSSWAVGDHLVLSEADSRESEARMVAWVAALVIGALVITPMWGVAALALTVIFRRRSNLLTFCAWGLVAVGFAFLLAQQVRTGAQPGFGWPEVFARAHRPMLLGLVLLWVGGIRSRPLRDRER